MMWGTAQIGIGGTDLIKVNTVNMAFLRHFSNNFGKRFSPNVA
jgi:hypothetical protein